jgi:hypothetical protein
MVLGLQLYRGWKAIYPGEGKKCYLIVAFQTVTIYTVFLKEVALGPLLYSIFNNDLPSVMNKARDVMLADDYNV